MMRYIAAILLMCATAFGQSPREPRILYFQSSSCVPCKVALDDLRPWLQSTGWSVGQSERDHLQIVNIDQREDLAELYGVTQTPMVALAGSVGGVAIPYRGRQTIMRIMSDPRVYAGPKTASRFNVQDEGQLLRIGCKLRPDLGSGVNTDYGVVTCSHCVRGSTVQVECDGETAVGTVVARDVVSDVALISVPWKQQHPTVPIAKGTPYGMMSLVARQRDGSAGVTNSMALHETLDGMWLTREPTVAGQSGGGYIGANGDLVGIVSGNVVDHEPFRGLIIPASAIRKLLAPRPKATASHAGQHSHLCSRCGNEWWHGAEASGSTQAHRCPSCGKLEWDVNRSAPRLAMPVFKSRATAGCPSGNCPWNR